MRALTLILIAAFLFAQAVTAAEADDATLHYTTRSWRLENGLPDNSVSLLAQTPDGYLWVGTARGLARMDGVRFTVINPGESVTALAVDSSGALWIGLNDGGLSRFQNGSTEHLVASDRSQFGEVHSLLATSGALHIGAQNGWFTWTRKTGVSIIIESNVVGSVFSLSADASGTIWAGTAKGVWKYANGKAESSAPKSTVVSAIVSSLDGTLRMASETAGLLEIPPGGVAPRRIWPVSQAQSFCVLRNGEIWIASGRGVIERIPTGGRSKIVLDTGANTVNAMFEDREGNLWLATEGSGLIQVRSKLLKLFHPDEGVGVMSCTDLASSEVWFAGRNGKIYRSVAGKVESRSFTSHPSIFVESLLGTREGGLLLSTRFEGVLYWPGRGSSLQTRGSATAVAALFEDRAGRLWLASARDGVMFWEGSGWRAVKASDGAPILDACTFAEDMDGRIWIGLRRGALIERSNGETQLHVPDLLLGSRIQSLYADAEGNLWIGTQNGLILHSSGQFARLTIANGLQDSDIRQILDDLRGNLWFSSRSGIFRVAKASLIECALDKRSFVHSTVFGPEDGFAPLDGIGSIQPASTKMSDGKLYFATTEGMAVIDSVHAAALDAPIPAVIEEVIVDNKQLRTPKERGAVKISAGYQHLSLRFTGLSYVAPERTQFRFRMSGIDSDWVSAGGHRIASYGRLPGGNHRFEVVAQSRDGTWPASGAVLLFQVAPRYWETAWFRAFIVAAVFALVALFWFQRLARQREINAVREQITRDLHDDLGSNLGSIALLTEALQRPAARTNNEQLLHEINRIARQTLDGMRDTLWFVDPGKDSVADLIAHLRQLADSMLKNTPHEFHAPDKLEPSRVPLELKRGIVLIFKEALHNALRHSQATHLNVFTNVEQHRFFFEVVDDGVGFDPTNASGGHGLENMKHRAEKLRGKIQIASEQGRGARVRFEVNLFDG